MAKERNKKYFIERERIDNKKKFFSPNYFIHSLLSFAVCQEWLVREDNALAYQLQNQESNVKTN